MNLKYELKQNTWMPGYGWGNGYVILPKDHAFHGVGYDDIPVTVHGGLTYAKTEPNGDWMVGFDTCHSGDTAEVCTKEWVEAETLSLKTQLEALANGGPKSD